LKFGPGGSATAARIARFLSRFCPGIAFFQVVETVISTETVGLRFSGKVNASRHHARRDPRVVHFTPRVCQQFLLADLADTPDSAISLHSPAPAANRVVAHPRVATKATKFTTLIGATSTAAEN
jgi:hypothetical protein